jgi:hypothetical protein
MRKLQTIIHVTTKEQTKIRKNKREKMIKGKKKKKKQ